MEHLICTRKKNPSGFDVCYHWIAATEAEANGSKWLKSSGQMIFSPCGIWLLWGWQGNWSLGPLFRTDELLHKKLLCGISSNCCLLKSELSSSTCILSKKILVIQVDGFKPGKDDWMEAVCLQILASVHALDSLLICLEKLCSVVRSLVFSYWLYRELGYLSSCHYLSWSICISKSIVK